MIDRYRWRGGDEAVLAFGQPDWPTLLILEPFFEEANRTRQVLVQAMRILAREYRVASILPDLPGTGDSLVPTGDARWGDWGDAVAAAAALIRGPRYIASVRGGALLDQFASATARWRLQPVTGAALLRDMIRAKAISSGQKASGVTEQARKSTTELMGNAIHPSLFTALEAATPEAGSARVVRLDDGPEPADYRPAAVAVWRRSEPVCDPTLVSVIVDDLTSWLGQCAQQ